MGGGGRRGSRGEWGEWRCISLVFENSILLIRVQGYRGLKEKLQTVKTVHTLRYSVLNISEYFRGVVLCESFGIYGAANLGIWCGDIYDVIMRLYARLGNYLSFYST